MEIGKRHIVDVMIIDGTVDGAGSGEKKFKSQGSPKEKFSTELEVVLESQHRLQQ